MPLARSPKSSPTTFRSGLDALNRLFAESLWRAKASSCSDAETTVKESKNANERVEIIDKQLQRWRDESIAAIRQWTPKYFDLALSRRGLIDRLGKEWVTRKVKRVLAECFGHDLNSVVWWFAMASEGKSLQPDDRKLSPKMRWNAPRWLLPNGAATYDLLLPAARSFVIRFYRVIEEELDKALLDRAIKDTDHGRHASDQADKDTESKRAAIITKVSNPDKYRIVRTDEAALYFICNVRTINRWVKSGKLKAGEKRGTVTTKSIRELEQKRQKRRRSHSSIQTNYLPKL